jgi:hypothetical protein
MQLPKAPLLALVPVLCLGCLCVGPCAAQAQDSNLGGDLKVGLLGMGNDSWPFSGPARGPTDPQNAGLEGFEVRGRQGPARRSRAGLGALAAVPPPPGKPTVGSSDAQNSAGWLSIPIQRPACTRVQVALMNDVCKRANLSCTAGAPAAAAGLAASQARHAACSARQHLTLQPSACCYCRYSQPLPPMIPLLPP